MKRTAILIEASQIPDHADLQGARADVQNYKDWLMSNNGGAWEEDEINILRHPTQDTLRATIQAASLCDYAFVTFSGHGRHVVKGADDCTMIRINKNQEYSALQLGYGFTRATIVVDACRTVELEKLTETHTAALAKALEHLDSWSRRQHRALFDQKVMVAERGTIFLYSCSLDESANERRNGGAFSFRLAQAGRDWSMRHASPGIINVLAAFQAAADSTHRRYPQQTPTIEGSIRRNTYFPFAVRA